MTSEWQGGPDAPDAPTPPVSTHRARPTRASTRAAARTTTDGDAPPPGPGKSSPDPDRRRRWVTIALVGALVLALAATIYLAALSRSWADRAGRLEGTASELGAELAQTRADLDESASTLALVESQLDGAQEQIHELADAVAQTGDDREVQRQVADYQAQISAAATNVAEAMDQCISAQEDLIDNLEEAAMKLSEQEAAPSPSASASATPEPRVTLDTDTLAEQRSDVTELCAGAQDANDDLQERVDEE